MKDFFLCMLKTDCPYSLKKLLVYVFTLLVIYVIIFTGKDFYEILMFIAVMLGVRSFEGIQKMKINKPNENQG